MQNSKLRALLLIMLSATVAACSSAETAKPKASPKPALSEYRYPVHAPDVETPPPAHPTTLIYGATVMTAAGKTFSPGYILLHKGLIAAIGEGDGPGTGSNQAGDINLSKAERIELKGAFITPGIIDTHSHMGVYAFPDTHAHDDGNEMVTPITPYAWAEHAFWPQDPALRRAVAAGVTTIQVLPGSGNLIGGRSFIAKLTPKTSARAMRFNGAVQGLKMACGENPKRYYGERGGPQTRMGNVAGYRRAFLQAMDYRRSWQTYARDLEHWQKTEAKKSQGKGDDKSSDDDKSEIKDPPSPPSKDIGMETLLLALDKKLYIHNHCYRADEMHIMLDLAKEFGFTIRSFHHGLEAYKLADRLAKEDVSVSTWADWWGYKMEAYDGIPHNAPLLAKAGVRAIIHSDSAIEIRHLNHEAIKARAAGARLGIEFTDDEVLRWFTYNAAWALGVQDKVGTLEVGKMADIAIWNGSPFSTYSLVQRVFIDGAEVFDRMKQSRPGDFELGQNAGLPELQ